MDPLTAKYPHYTPYSFSGNRVIDVIELEGLEEFIVHSASFAPFDQFATPLQIGPGFEEAPMLSDRPLIIGPFSGDGDDRKFGVDPYASSRISGYVGVDFSSSGIKINIEPRGEVLGQQI